MDDLISRQAAIDALAMMMPRSYTPDGSHPADEGIFMAQEIYADCIQMLKELPSAEPQERKTGRWEDGHRYGYNGTYWFIYCSECMYERDDDNHEKDTPFCPNCGADMRQREE